MKWRDLSWRLRVPLAITAVIVITEVVVTTLLVTRALTDARRDLEASAKSLTTLLARSLRDPILRDDLWQAFEVARAPVAERGQDSALIGVVVLDASRKVYVSSDPRRFAVLMSADALTEPLAVIARQAAVDTKFHFALGRGAAGPELAAAGPVLAEDGTRLGTVVLDYDGAVYAQRLRSAVLEVALFSLPGLLLLVPLGWYAGKRLAEPLVQMAHALAQVSRAPPDEVRKLLPPEGGDEIGRLSTQALHMLDGLARKSALEQEVMASDRLAAVGRVSAAIAHEINNPLGGMLNAIDTVQRHGQPDPFTHKTLGLLGRGLQQIRTTVGALLVEARLDSPALTEADWQDLHTLIQPQVAARGLQLHWRVAAAAGAALPLPAHLVRQLVLNLLLNAVKAADAGGRIALDVTDGDGSLAIEVANSGAPIAPELLGRLFEPFAAATERDGKRAYGLGLWVCWQIVQQLRGSISADSSDAGTRFVVTLPVSPRTAA